MKIIFFIKGNSSKSSLQCDGERLLNFELGKTRYWLYLKSNKLSYHLFAWLCQMQSFLNKACHCIIGIVLIFHSACNMFRSLIHVFAFIFFLLIMGHINILYLINCLPYRNIVNFNLQMEVDLTKNVTLDILIHY